MDRRMRKALQEIVNLSEERKLFLALDSFQTLLPAFGRFDPAHRGVYLICTVFSTAAAADGTLTTQEYALIAALMKAETGSDFSRDEVLELVKAAGNKYHIIQQLAESLNDDEKAKLITLIAVICSIDDTITKEEIDYIDSLF